VVHHQGRPIPCSSRAETAAASQHSGGQASEGPGEDPRPALGTALGATVSAWQCHSAGTGSSSPARGGGFEQPYGAQAFRGAEEGPLSTQLLRYISEVLHTIGKQTASDTEWYDRDCANARAGGRRGGAAPHELSNSFECRSSLQRPGCHLRLNRSSWGAEGVQPP